MSEPKKNKGEITFTSEDSPLFIFDGPGDTTRRPRRANNPREWPPKTTLPPIPPADGEPAPPAKDAQGE